MAFLPKITRLAVFTAGLALAPVLPAAETPLAPAVQQRLDLLRTGFEAFVLNQCSLPYETGIKALNAKVQPLLERAGGAAAQRTDLDGLVRIKSDLQRIAQGQVLTAVAEAPPESLKHAYATYKLELDRLEALKKASLADAKLRYDRGLEGVQNELTQAQEVAAALQVKQLREALTLADAPPVPSTTAGSTPDGGSENLLANGDFKKGTLKWEMTTHEHTSNAKMSVDKKVLFHDKPTLRVSNPELTDTHVSQTVKVKPNTRYRLSGFIKAQDIVDAKGRSSTDAAAGMNGGASLTITGKYGYRTRQVITDEWTEVSEEFKTQSESELVFECRLGYFGSTVSGTAWFAEVTLTEVTAATPQAAAATTPPPPPSAVPQKWTYHMKLTDMTSLASIELNPDGSFTMSHQEPGTWQQSPTDGVITISFKDKTRWTMTLNDADTAMLDRPDVGRRYMRVRRG